MNRILLIAAFLVATISGERVPMAAESESLPSDVAKAVSELRSLANQQFIAPSGVKPSKLREYLPAAHEKFLESLKTLNGQVDDALAKRIQESTAGGVESNLITMARDYSKHPEHYKTLNSVYQPDDHGQVVFRPGSPTAKHTVDEYRPAWELLLLAPTSEQSRFMRSTCFEALGDIRSDASIPLLVFLFERASTAKVERSQASVDQSQLIGVLGHYGNKAGLEGLLKCKSIWETVPPVAPNRPQTPKDWALLYLRDQNNLGNGDQWRAVIEKTLKEETLSDADRSFLQEVLDKPASK